MLIKYQVLFFVTCLICSSLALLNNHRLELPKVSNFFGKKFTTISEAINDGVQFIEQYKNAYNLPSLLFGISVRGKMIFQKSWGFTDLENQVEATMSSKYRICSISKTFTSAYIGRLVDEGKLTYNTSVHKILSEKDFPRKTWQGEPVDITIGQLLAHRAGLHVTNELTDFNDVILTKNTTQMIHKFKDEPLHFKPDTAFAYSNYGYQVLGAVIEALTGKTYESVIKDFFKEHELHHTTVDDLEKLVKHRAKYYRYQPSTDTKLNLPTYLFDELFMTEGYYSSGGLLSTLPDILQYGQMMIDSFQENPNAILPKSIVEQMWYPHSPNISQSAQGHNSYGYGWFISEITNPEPYHVRMPKFVWHSGGLVGTTTMLLIYPQEEIVGVAFANKGAAVGLDQMIIYMAENIHPFVH